jgi:hypothetical protein
MRRLRILTAIPLVAGLLFAGAATTAAQSSPIIPSFPGMGDLPYIAAGFTCWFPDVQPSGAPTTNSANESEVTDDSFVLLTSSTPALPTVPGLPNTPGVDLNFLKCFFHYPEGAIQGAPYVAHGFFCDYRTTDSPTTTGQPYENHVFAHSTLIVRDEFAILLCWGTRTNV